MTFAKQYKVLAVLFVVSLILTVPAPAKSETQESLKSRMMGRLPAIMELKARGIVGENNRGYLEFRAAAEQQNIVSEENRDRGIIYKAIAKQQGTTPDVVGTRRAIQIANKAEPGHLLQDANGNWYKK